MWKIAWGILQDAADIADVEDCISEVFYKLWKSPELLDPEKGSIRNYLSQMTRNAAIDLLRKRSRERTTDLDEEAYEDEYTDTVFLEVIQNEDKEMLLKIMDAMDERDRELLTRRFFSNQKPAQISKEMQIPVREVTNRLYRIKSNIRNQMS